mgnify:FL=1
MSDTALYVGNNMEFVVASISDVTIFFNNTGADSDTEKYPHNSNINQAASARKIAIRPNQTIQIVGMDNVTFKDPITVIINTTWTERFSERFGKPISKMILRTTIADTTIRIRWHGGY